MPSALHYLPIEKRLTFAQRYHDHIENDGYSLTHTLVHLREEDRFAFASANQEKIPRGHIILITRLLPKESRLLFVQTNHTKIKYGYEFLQILKELSDNERLIFIQNHHSIIFDGKELGKLLRHLPENERVTTAISNHVNIHDGSGLAYVLNQLPKDSSNILKSFAADLGQKPQTSQGCSCLQSNH